jgi:hypothetical protein
VVYETPERGQCGGPLPRVYPGHQRIRTASFKWSTLRRIPQWRNGARDIDAMRADIRGLKRRASFFLPEMLAREWRAC